MRSSSRSRRSSRGPLLAVALLLLLGACEPADAPPLASPSTSASPSASPLEPVKRGGSVTFGVIGEPATLDPYSPLASDLTYELLRPVYPTLFRFRPIVTAEGLRTDATPDLAKSWNSAPGGLEVVLRDREWSDGNPITARDVAMSLERGGGSSSTFGAGTLSRVRNVRTEVLGPRRLILHGGGASPLSFGSPLFVLPRGRLDLEISGGAFAVRRRVPGLQIEYVRNPSWAGPEAHLNRVTVQFIEDMGTMLALLEDGRLDAAAPLSAVNLGERLDAAQLEHSSEIGWESIALDFEEADIDQASRTAVAGSINKRAIERGLIRADGGVGELLFPYGFPPPESPLPALPSPNGDVPDVQMAVAKGDELTGQIQEVIQLQLEDAGSEAELVTGDWRTFYGEWRTDSPVDVSIVRILGGPSYSVPQELNMIRAVEGFPLFQVKTYVAWRPRAVKGLQANPSIEGPLWNMQEWSKV